MTKRNKTSEQLSAYLDGALSEADVATLKKALAREPELVRELDALRATRALVRRLPREHAPDDFARRVVARLERRSLLEPGLQARPSPSRRRLVVVAAAAAVFLAAGVGTYVALLMFPSSSSTTVANAPRRPAPDQPLALADKKPTLAIEQAGSRDAARGGEHETELNKDAVAKAPGGVGAGKPGLDREGPLAVPGPETIYVPVNAPDLTVARRGLEKTLFEMEVPPATDETAGNGPPPRPAAPAYRTVEASATQIKYLVANVSRSQLPVLVKKLEDFRRRQDASQDSLEGAQTTLALAEASTEQAGAKVATNAAVLDRGAFLRQVLAEGERAEPPAKSLVADGTELASAEPTGREKTIESNAKFAQKAKSFDSSRAGPGRYDQPGKAPKGGAPGDGQLDMAGGAAPGVPSDMPRPALNAPAAPSPVAKAAPSAPAAPAAKEGPQPAEELALAEASHRPSPIEGTSQAVVLNRGEYLRSVRAEAQRAGGQAATAPADAAKDRHSPGTEVAAGSGTSDQKAALAADKLERDDVAAHQAASKPAELAKADSADRRAGELRQAQSAPAPSDHRVISVQSKVASSWARGRGEALYNVCIILNTPPAPESEPPTLQRAEEKEEQEGEPPARQ